MVSLVERRRARDVPAYHRRMPETPADTAQRDYTNLDALKPGKSRLATMQRVADALWVHFQTEADGDRGYSWVGFYVGPGEEADGVIAGDDEMLLAARRDKPACSPIGLHGACGRSLMERRTLIVTDVAHLGAGYVACDPKDRSELVIPLYDELGQTWGVFDADSFDAGAFPEPAAEAVQRILERTGLTTEPPEDAEPALVV